VVSEKGNRNPTIAAIYAIINPLERKFNNSVETKVWSCWDYCNKKGWKVEYVFVDRHERMERMRNPNFDLMLQKANRGDFDVIVWNSDKLTSPIFKFLQKIKGQIGTEL
jgi:hypothetical protein